MNGSSLESSRLSAQNLSMPNSVSKMTVTEDKPSLSLFWRFRLSSISLVAAVLRSLPSLTRCGAGPKTIYYVLIMASGCKFEIVVRCREWFFKNVIHKLCDFWCKIIEEVGKPHLLIGYFANTKWSLVENETLWSIVFSEGGRIEVACHGKSESFEFLQDSLISGAISSSHQSQYQ
ncbi:unnamed protein product [Hymenolepis diminuta]|uniref:Uncharacterized protein n=1 Tax=Hymenolepis diminuta TaxID=6216 RepID=A0A564Y8Y0_HYMDI|nr:unnamed protein product [Hymenolepis diminuta]